MKFTLKFKSKKGYPVSLPVQDGFEQVEHIRNELQLPDYPIENIFPYINVNVREVSMTVPERIAKKSRKFRLSSILEIFVPEESMNKYTLRVPRIIEHEDGKKELNLMRYSDSHLQMALNEIIYSISVIKDWEEAGFPETWDPLSDKKHFFYDPEKDNKLIM